MNVNPQQVRAADAEGERQTGPGAQGHIFLADFLGFILNIARGNFT